MREQRVFPQFLAFYLLASAACSGSATAKITLNADSGPGGKTSLDSGNTTRLPDGNISAGADASTDAAAPSVDAGKAAVACKVDADCDDKLYCSGSETCTGGKCKSAGDAPCKGQVCDEGKQLCHAPVTQDVVTLDPSTKLQTMLGWEATAQASHRNPNYAAWRDTLLDQAVNDLGLTRLRLEITSGVESTAGGGYPIVNDDNDPNHINWAGFHFEQTDEAVEKIVLPMKKLVEKNGEKLYINLCYVSFLDGKNHATPMPSLHAEQPAEYAEFVLATYKHLKDKYNLDLDSWEVILEPDNVSAWTGPRIGNAIVAAGALLKKNGFKPAFVAPSNTDMSAAITYYDQMTAITGVTALLKEFSYHRYGGVSDMALQNIGMRSTRDHIGSAMLEHIAADYFELHKDLTLAHDTSWQQFTLASTDNSYDGAQYYVIDNSSTATPQVTIASRTKFLRQYFKYVRPGAVRFGAKASSANYEPIAFKNKNGKDVVVVKANGQGTFAIDGLSDGIYGVKYTTNAEYDINLPDHPVFGGQLTVTQIPQAGVITIYGK